MLTRLFFLFVSECKNSPQCSPAKHHFDECVERVHQQESEGEAKEDCVEECTFLHTIPFAFSPLYRSQKKRREIARQFFF